MLWRITVARRRCTDIAPQVPGRCQCQASLQCSGYMVSGSVVLGILIFNYVNKKENKLLGLRDVRSVKRLHHIVKTGAQPPRTHITKIKVSNPHNGEAETGGSLGLTGGAMWLNGWTPSSSERLCLKEQHGWRLTPEADHWSPHACMHTCTCTYMISRKHAHIPIYQ